LKKYGSFYQIPNRLAIGDMEGSGIFLFTSCQPGRTPWYANLPIGTHESRRLSEENNSINTKLYPPFLLQTESAWESLKAFSKPIRRLAFPGLPLILIEYVPEYNLVEENKYQRQAIMIYQA